MASQSLYRKWRSQTFDEMVGQQDIVRTLRNALANNTLKHAYLFTGPRGTGKTTTARLLAKTVNCTNPQNGEPCNECQQCREITAGTSFNVIEIDAASNRGIDNIRELRERIMVPPATGKYKIYILDEAHMLTTEAFNALLKTLEEPPDYAIFVLATTEAHKLLSTVISRCECHHFKRFSSRQIVGHLLFVAKEEQIELEQSAAELIARSAAGGMRDALSLLDQAIAYAGNVISLAQVQAMLGVADPHAVSKLMTHIAGLDSPALLYVIHELAEAGADLRQLNTQIIEYWRALMLAKAGADVATILDLTEDEVHEIQQLTPGFTLEELTECARIFAQNDLMQKNQGTPQLGLELASLECIELHRRVQSGQPVARLGSIAPPLTAAPTQTSTPRVTMSTSAPAARPATSTPQSVSPVVTRRDTPNTEPLHPVENRRDEPAASRLQSIEDGEMSASAPVTRAHARLTLPQVQVAWENVKRRTMQKSRMLGTYIGLCDVLNVEDGEEQQIIVVQAHKPMHYTNITTAENFPEDVNWALSTEFNMPCKIRVLAPGQRYFAPQAQGTASYSVGVAPPQPSAYREPVRQGDKPVREESARPGQDKASDSPDLSARPASPPTDSYQQQSLARPRGVKENKRVSLSREELEKKAQQNPVVQEALRTFRATIKDIQPK